MTILSDYLGFWLLQALAMVATCVLIPKLKITGLFGPLVAVVAIALINTHIWDAALFFHLPTDFTQNAGLLLLVNGAIFWLTIKAVPGIEIEGFLPAIIAPVVFTLTSMVINTYGRSIDWQLIATEGLKAISATKEYFENANDSSLNPDSRFPHSDGDGKQRK